MDSRLKLLEKLKIKLSGHLYVGDEIRDGWKEPAPFYIFKCPIHGYVKSYVRGYSERLECPDCLKEAQLVNEIT
ncbi:hypothetical protein ACFL0D_02700 [Thermoproteota archaeon]